jgi:hypothetical protein
METAFMGLGVHRKDVWLGKDETAQIFNDDNFAPVLLVVYLKPTWDADLVKCGKVT